MSIFNGPHLTAVTCSIIYVMIMIMVSCKGLNNCILASLQILYKMAIFKYIIPIILSFAVTRCNIFFVIGDASIMPR